MRSGILIAYDDPEPEGPGVFLFYVYPMCFSKIGKFRSLMEMEEKGVVKECLVPNIQGNSALAGISKKLGREKLESIVPEIEVLFKSVGLETFKLPVVG